jgi:tryptophan-rich sensory protein
MPEKPTGSLRPVVSVLLILTGCYAVGFVASIAINRALEFWYLVVNRPVWALPGYMFVPISTVSYGLTGAALWKLRPSMKEILLVIVQLLLVVLWSWTFFGWQRPFPAFIVAIFLWLTTLAAALASRRACLASFRCLIPVLAWTTYQLALTIAVWRMNRS